MLKMVVKLTILDHYSVEKQGKRNQRNFLKNLY